VASIAKAKAISDLGQRLPTMLGERAASDSAPKRPFTAKLAASGTRASGRLSDLIDPVSQLTMQKMPAHDVEAGRATASRAREGVAHRPGEVPLVQALATVTRS